MFYLIVEILHSGYLVLTAALCKRLHHRFPDIPSPNYHRYHRITSDYHRESLSDGPTDHLKRIGRTIFIKSKMLLFSLYIDDLNPDFQMKNSQLH